MAEHSPTRSSTTASRLIRSGIGRIAQPLLTTAPTQHGTERSAGVLPLTASLYFTFSLPPLSMREIGAVIPPLHPRDQRQSLRNRQGAERQHDFHEPPQL